MSDSEEMAEAKLQKLIDLVEKQTKALEVNNKLVDTNNKLLADVLEENRQLKNRISALEDANRKLQVQNPPAADLMRTFLKCQREAEEQEHKKPNFVIYGLKEGNSSRTDREVVEDIFKHSGADPNCIMDVFRMGRTGKFPRLVKVLTNNTDEKRKIMAHQNEAMKQVGEFEMSKDKSVVGFSRYFRDDLTNYQRKLYSDLKTERQKLNDNVESGYIWRIRDFELVKKRVFQNS